MMNERKLEDITAPQDDVERWVIATYAMWSEYYSEGNWQYIAGSPVKEEGASDMRLMLSRDWGIDDREELLNTVFYLTAIYQDVDEIEPEDIETGAWDLCRACQILGMAFVGGLISRGEMMHFSLMVCSLMQYYYPSWLNLYSSYLKGYKEWRLEDEDDDDEDDEYEDDDEDDGYDDEDDDDGYDGEDEDDGYEDDSDDDDDDEDDEDDDDDEEDDDEDDDDEAMEDVEARENICRRLLIMPNGPCSVPWNLELPIDFDDEDEE